MKIIAELDIRDGDFIKICTSKVVYDIIEESATQYKITNDLDVEVWLDKTLFVLIPDNLVVDSQTSIQSLYNRIKQRDTDYHKVYKERMGIQVMTWPEEDAARHKKTHTSQEGLPEGHTIDHNGRT